MLIDVDKSNVVIECRSINYNYIVNADTIKHRAFNSFNKGPSPSLISTLMFIMFLETIENLSLDFNSLMNVILPLIDVVIIIILSAKLIFQNFNLFANLMKEIKGM
ncbi:hypothetical protein Pfo_014024 [Paulownia fortunei]|nr:hypothetical protein Pfo_014024 [Paulownia fortunei]